MAQVIAPPMKFETGQIEGLHPDRAMYGTFMTFSDPDGNGWMVQEVDRERESAAPGA